MSTITGTAGDNTLIGTSGDDTIYGLGGNDSLQGLAGNDVLDGGAGNDTLDGGSGQDFASYADAASAVSVNLSLTGAQDTVGAGTDTLISIEKLIGSNYNDVLHGDGLANSLFGGAGDDRLYGGSGDDNLYGSAGNDILDGGLGNDYLDGGAGSDTASYATANAAVHVSLAITGPQATGGAGEDTLVSIENLLGSAFNDTLTGDANANKLNGGAGDDMLIGGAGQDVMIGGLGNDTFVFNALGDTTPGAPDIITDFTSGQDRIDLHQIDANTGLAGDQAFHVGGGGGHAGDLVVSAFDAVHDRTEIDLYVDNNASIDAKIWLLGDHHALTAADFVL